MFDQTHARIRSLLLRLIELFNPDVARTVSLVTASADAGGDFEVSIPIAAGTRYAVVMSSASTVAAGTVEIIQTDEATSAAGTYWLNVTGGTDVNAQENVIADLSALTAGTASSVKVFSFEFPAIAPYILFYGAGFTQGDMVDIRLVPIR